MPNPFDPTECAARLSDCCDASVDLVEALRAGEISPADNIGSGETALSLVAATIFAVESIHRACADDQALLIDGMRALNAAWREKIVALQDAAP